MGSGPGETGKRPPEVTAVVTERIPAGEAGEGADFAGELLSMEDIYRAAGIVGPRRGYSINKVVEMLHSEHIRGCGGSNYRRSGARREGEARSNRHLAGRAEKIVRGAMGSEGGRKPSDTGRAGDGEGVLHGARTAEPGWCSPGKSYVRELADDKAAGSADYGS